ncbi:phosphatidylglycerol lysyltransferase domain-containing protein, partial [Treponema sp. R6D11]
MNVPKSETELFDRTFFEILPNRDSFEYCYNIEKLATLSGKKMNKKRNHWNAFKNSNYELKPINPDETKKFYDEIYESHKQNGDKMFACEKEKIDYIL